MVRFSKAVCLLAVAVIALTSPVVAQGTYTQIDVPGATETVIYGINSAGDTVGYYIDIDGQYHGFLRTSGIFSRLDVPGAVSTVPEGINDMGQIVGYSDQGGFLYDISTGVFTKLQYPPSIGSFDGSFVMPYAINNAGTIAGCIQGHEKCVGFELNGTTYTTIKAPGAVSTNLTSINNLGEALVWSLDVSGNVSYYLFSDKLTKLESQNDHWPSGINDANAIVGLRGVRKRRSRQQTRDRACDPLPCVRLGRYVRFEWGSPKLAEWWGKRRT